MAYGYLRFLTCGNVDDGKSTLIGRMLYDSGSVFKDQLMEIEGSSKGDELDLSLLVDGLESERSQGITIDVAYRYFSTTKKKFIIADSPGHAEYTRNMVVAASVSNVAVLLIDARNGIQEQTTRHSYINNLMSVKHIVIAVNKMDLVDYSEEVFNKIQADYKKLAVKMDFDSITFIPVSAKVGDNVVNKSDKMPWYKGKTLINTLESIEIQDRKEDFFAMSVQSVIRLESDKRGYRGTISSGSVKIGDKVVILPNFKNATIDTIIHSEQNKEQVDRLQSVTLSIEEDVDISRGTIIASPNEELSRANTFVRSSFNAEIIWFYDSLSDEKKQYIIKINHNKTRGMIKKINYLTDVNTLNIYNRDEIRQNEIASVEISLANDIAFTDYHDDRHCGSFILIDPDTNQTIGAGVIRAKKIEKDPKVVSQRSMFSMFKKIFAGF